MKTNIQSEANKKIKKLLLFFIIFMQGFLYIQKSDAANYYVSPSGIDTNIGTSLAAPVKTITKALAMAKSNGDIVYVMTGTYNEHVVVNQNDITIKAYPNNKPVIDGGSTLPGRDWSSLVDLNGSGVIFSGFEIKNSNVNCTFEGGVGLTSGGNNNTISFVYAHDNCSSGIFVKGDNNIVEDSEVYHSSLVWPIYHGANGKGWGSGLSVARGGWNPATPGITTGAIIRRNKVHENWGEGLSCFEATKCLIEDNIVYNNYAANLYLSDATFSTVQRNIVYITNPNNIGEGNPTTEGIVLADERSDKPRSTDNIIINNFLYNADLSAFDWTIVNGSGLVNDIIANNTVVDAALEINVGQSANITHVNTQVRNNIIYSDRADAIKNITSGVIFSNNNYSGSGTVYGKSSFDVVGDPLLTRTGSTALGNLTGEYFKTQIGSPVLNLGAPIATVTEDFFRTARGAAPDVGGHQLTDSNFDSIAPSAPSSLSAIAISSTQVNLTWGVSIDNVSVAGYKIYRDGTEIGTSITTSFTDTSVVGGTTYNYTVSAYDTYGNFSTASNTATAQTPSSVPAAETVKFYSYSAGNITANSATIKWSTNVPAGGTLYYRVNSSSNALSVGVGKSTSQSIKLTGLQRNTKYQYDIWVWANGVTISTPPLYFTTTK